MEKAKGKDEVMNSLFLSIEDLQKHPELPGIMEKMGKEAKAWWYMETNLLVGKKHNRGGMSFSDVTDNSIVSFSVIEQIKEKCVPTFSFTELWEVLPDFFLKDGTNYSKILSVGNNNNEPYFITYAFIGWCSNKVLASYIKSGKTPQEACAELICYLDMEGLLK